MKRYALGLALATSLAAVASGTNVLAQSQATPPAAQLDQQQTQQPSAPSTDMRMQGMEHGRGMRQQGTEHRGGTQGMGPRMMDRQPEK